MRKLKATYLELPRPATTESVEVEESSDILVVAAIPGPQEKVHTFQSTDMVGREGAAPF